MKFVFKIAAALLVALAIGGGSALFIIERSLQSSDVKNGPWHINLTIGSEAVGPYMRAASAQAGLLSPTKSETLSFTAFTDDEGAALDSVCNYKITGGDLPARWWSLTAYGADGYLIPNPQDRYSFGANNVARAEDGTYVIHLAPTAKSGNRLPSGKRRQHISVTLRLYSPEAAAITAPSIIELPAITRETCP